jgi:hypothetical protein
MFQLTDLHPKRIGGGQAVDLQQSPLRWPGW